MIRIAPPALRAALGAAWLALALGAIPAAVQAQTGEAVLTKRATELRDAAGTAGRSVADLPAQSPLTRLGERQGPWVRVNTASGATGWVHLFDIGPAAGPSSNTGGLASGALRGITSLFSKGGPTTVATSTIGVRGLSAEDLAQAQPNTRAVTQMETLRQTETQARAFARDAALAPVEVAPLEEAARSASPAPARGGNP